MTSVLQPRMTEPSPTLDPPAGPSAQVASAVHRKVAVRGSGGVSATIIVVARQGRVWISIMPPFTWEAILEPITVDELTHTLELAREDAMKMTTAPQKQASQLNRTVRREITGKATAIPGTRIVTRDPSSPL